MAIQPGRPPPHLGAAFLTPSLTIDEHIQLRDIHRHCTVFGASAPGMQVSTCSVKCADAKSHSCPSGALLPNGTKHHEHSCTKHPTTPIVIPLHPITSKCGGLEGHLHASHRLECQRLRHTLWHYGHEQSGSVYAQTASAPVAHEQDVDAGAAEALPASHDGEGTVCTERCA